MDVEAVYDATSWAVAHARSGAGPVFLDCRCYRYVGHNTGEHLLGLKYRSEEEMALWRSRDPLGLTGAALVDRGFMDRDGLAALDAQVESDIADAGDRARMSQAPDPGSALDFMYATATVTTATRWGTR
jgi:pyruvate dehydrogenase E1 component alpha subunit